MISKTKKHLSESAKISYLIGYLRDYALKQVSHLSLTDSNLYVDILIVTSNDMREMKDLYKNCYERMLEDGFILRSWNSN